MSSFLYLPLFQFTEPQDEIHHGWLEGVLVRDVDSDICLNVENEMRDFVVHNNDMQAALGIEGVLNLEDRVLDMMPLMLEIRAAGSAVISIRKVN